MDAEFFNLLFKAGLVAIISFTVPFGFWTLICFETSCDVYSDEIMTKREWVVLSLVSLVIMIITLLIFGTIITK